MGAIYTQVLHAESTAWTTFNSQEIHQVSPDIHSGFAGYEAVLASFGNTLTILKNKELRGKRNTPSVHPAAVTTR